LTGAPPDAEANIDHCQAEGQVVMSAAFRWEQRRQFFRCVSEAGSWEELRPALVDSWVRFAELLGSSVPADVRNEISLSFFGSSGRVTFGHADREFPGVAWDKVPQDYVWQVMCKCPWVEGEWERRDEETLWEVGVTFARTCLECASASGVKAAFDRQQLGPVRVRGEGVTQSPAGFEVDLAELLDGFIPPLRQ
jgi:hypothetical protein